MIPFIPFEISLLTAAQSMIGIFLSTALVQSGIDKLADRKGNLDWLEGHFSSSILNGMGPLMLSIITVLELAGGGLCAVGAVLLMIGHTGNYLITGLLIAGFNFLALFFGQRVAKDYEGAAVLVGYFILTMLGILSFTI